MRYAPGWAGCAPCTSIGCHGPPFGIRPFEGLQFGPAVTILTQVASPPRDFGLRTLPSWIHLTRHLRASTIVGLLRPRGATVHQVLHCVRINRV